LIGLLGFLAEMGGKELGIRKGFIEWREFKMMNDSIENGSGL
jgi:hypothetical protein